MENQSSDDGHESAKKEAKELYEKIGEPWCPALNNPVSFNDAGFRHLLGQGRKPRSKSDQMRRFILLRSAKSIITSYRAKITDQRENIEERAKFWAITEQRNDEVITVVVRQVGAGKKHFFSIYNQKSKTALRRAVL